MAELKTKDIAAAMERFAPPSLAESYDNAGLLVGRYDMPVSGVLVNLDITEEMLDEAVKKGANMIVTHHPIWFTPRKRINEEDYVSRIIAGAIRRNMALYACHTNLDNVQQGVNEVIGNKLGVKGMKILSPVKEPMVKVHARGTFSGLTGVAGVLREMGAKQVNVGESAPDVFFLEALLAPHLKNEVIGAIRSASEGAEIHFVPTTEKSRDLGAGMMGSLPEPMAKKDFLAHVKAIFACGSIRYADFPGETIQKIAWCGGAGSFLTGAALRAGADAFITGDITYHKFFDNENRMLLMDIGHYESEQYTSELICNYLSKTFPNFAVHFSEIITNPVKYF